ncbi:hypothetical protein [Streptomyces griseocarneus]|uniref:hypothetical protein n=1 Tax=Streptomyces griseocarneus TaxID=51201 RepID=UPI00167EEAA2|nr:hypothetical protein [Streptomyces griseocarneus]MBZ6473943.1 hypothetical protein [Streptomyces griseocarneus]GHG66032.1 hypothetical protein GCM10018779_37180 [Streptomyces griseocarneus]
MADDHRYDWLDDDAVERLLRGDFVAGRDEKNTTKATNPTGTAGATGMSSALGTAGATGIAGTNAGGSMAGETGDPIADADAEAAVADANAADAEADATVVAERLDAVLRSLAAPAAAPGGAPLPGEEAAVAAFRAARASAAVAPAAAARRARPFSAVRSFLDRPLKTVLALTLAGCAVGGVAVAAGTGVLPSPFGRAAKSPDPARSVAAAEGSGTATAGPGTTAPGTTPSPGRTGGKHPGGSPEPHASGKPGKGAPSEPAGKETGPGHAPSATPPGGKGDGTKGDGQSGRTGQTWAARLCREFLTNGKRSGSGSGLDEEGVRTLERSAGGAAAIRTYCERLLSVIDGDEAGDDTSDGDGDPVLPRPPHSRSRPHTSLPEPLPVPGVTFSGGAAL